MPADEKNVMENVIKKWAKIKRLQCKKKALKPWNFIKKRLRHKVFPVNIAEVLRAPILRNNGQLLLLEAKRSETYSAPYQVSAMVFFLLQKWGSGRWQFYKSLFFLLSISLIHFSPLFHFYTLLVLWRFPGHRNGTFFKYLTHFFPRHSLSAPWKH